MARLRNQSQTCRVEDLAEHASSPEPHPQLTKQPGRPSAMNWFLGGLAVVAAFCSAIAAWQANDISERHLDNLVQHIRYHYEITDKSNWGIKLYQMSGPTYPLNLVKFTPLFDDASEGRSLEKSNLTSMAEGRYPEYSFSDIEKQICEEQTHGCGNRSIAGLTIEYTIYDEPRTLRLP